MEYKNASGDPKEVVRVYTPQPVVADATWQAVAADGAHTVALREDGALWAWGWNALGQLGNGTWLITGSGTLGHMTTVTFSSGVNGRGQWPLFAAASGGRDFCRDFRWL
jgi:alpha-tubulin suppressor-like RCC1 family protein